MPSCCDSSWCILSSQHCSSHRLQLCHLVYVPWNMLKSLRTQMVFELSLSKPPGPSNGPVIFYVVSKCWIGLASFVYKENGNINLIEKKLRRISEMWAVGFFWVLFIFWFLFPFSHPEILFPKTNTFLWKLHSINRSIHKDAALRIVVNLRSGVRACCQCHQVWYSKKFSSELNLVFTFFFFLNAKYA